MAQFLLLFNMGGTSSIPVVILAPDQDRAQQAGEFIAKRSSLSLQSVEKLGNIGAQFGAPTA